MLVAFTTFPCWHTFFFSCLEGNEELKNWIVRIQEDPAVKALKFDAESHKVFFDLYMAGNPNFDYGL